MASPAQTRRLVGAATLALATASLLWMVRGPRVAPWRDNVKVYAMFDQVGALRTGANVRLAGRSIGMVTEIGAAPAAGARRWRVTLSVDRAVLGQVAQNSLAIITPQGVLGKPMLEIAPPRGEPVGDLAAMAMPTLAGLDPASLDRTMERLYDHAGLLLSLRDELWPQWTRLTKAMDDVDDALAATDEESRAHAGQAWAAMQRAGGYWQAVSPAAEQTMASWAGAHRSAQRQRGQVATRLDALTSIWEQGTARWQAGDRQAMVRLRAFMTHVGAAIDDVQWLQANVAALMAEAPNGTALRLLADPELYDLFKMVAEKNTSELWRLIGHPDDGALDREAWRKQFDVPRP